MSLVLASLLVALFGLVLLVAAQSTALRSRIGVFNRIPDRYLLVAGIGITLFSCGAFAVLGALNWLVPEDLEYSIVPAENAVAGENFTYVFYVRNAGDGDAEIDHIRFNDELFDDLTVQAMRLYDLNRAQDTSNGRDVSFSENYDGDGLAVEVDQTLESGTGFALEVIFSAPFSGSYDGTLTVQQRVYDLVGRDTLTADFDVIVADAP